MLDILKFIRYILSVMAKKTFLIPAGCPACGGKLSVVETACDACGTLVRGRFEQNEFARLGAEDLSFLRAFIAARGSIKDVEAALGISYPTVRARLEKLIEALGLSPSSRAEDALKAELGARRGEILAKLETGELSVADAEKQLAELKE